MDGSALEVFRFMRPPLGPEGVACAQEETAQRLVQAAGRNRLVRIKGARSVVSGGLASGSARPTVRQVFPQGIGDAIRNRDGAPLASLPAPLFSIHRTPQ